MTLFFFSPFSSSEMQCAFSIRRETLLQSHATILKGVEGGEKPE